MNIVRYSYPAYRSLVTAPGRFYRSPWGALETEIDRLLSASLPDFAGAASAEGFPVDLYEDPKNSYVRAELPGVNRDDISVEMTDGTLTITAVRKTLAPEGQAAQSASFSRSLVIPAEISADRVSAAYENGVLTVTLPKPAPVQPRKIAVS